MSRKQLQRYVCLECHRSFALERVQRALTPAQVEQVLRLAQEGKSQRAIAREVKSSPTTVRRCLAARAGRLNTEG